jgi:pre-mRNA-processing factor 6
MGKPAPAGYIAGLGRGATGFTTRSDIGPAREASAAAIQKEEGTQGQGEGEGGDGGEERFQNDDPENEAGLFAGLPYEADDEEADQIYASVDIALAGRRNAWREKREKERKAQMAIHRPKITEQFADAKRELAKMTSEDWAFIPDAANVSRRKTKRDLGRERFVPVPDSVLSSARVAAETLSTTSSSDAASISQSMNQAPSANDGTRTDFVEMGAARDRVLGIKLDQVSDSVSGQSVVDPKGYLTDLNALMVKSEAEIGDIKKARLLLKSVITTNTSHAPGWIAAARLEEIAGKLAQARTLIERGCEECPQSEDIWLEAARLNTVANAKVILANAVRQLPTSVKIWLHASKLESDVPSQKRVLRRALEYIPNSVTLWKAAIELETDPDDARILLSRAVECVPLAVDMWLTLAKLESYERARKVLNKARQTIPTSHEIWLAAAQLEESAGNVNNIDVIIGKAIKALSVKGTELTRERWLEEARACEKSGGVETAKAIVYVLVRDHIFRYGDLMLVCIL